MDDATLTRLLRAADKVEIIELLSRYHQAIDTMHSMTNHVFTLLEGDRARTRSYLASKGGTLGIYEIEHLRTADGWRIRRLTLDEHFEPATLEALREQR